MTMKSVAFLLLALILALPITASAQIGALEDEDCGLLGLSCPVDATADTLVGSVLILINGFLTIIGVVALAVLIWGGVLYIISIGDDGRINTAKKIIIYAIVGLIVIGLSALIVNVVINFFAVPVS